MPVGTGSSPNLRGIFLSGGQINTDSLLRELVDYENAGLEIAPENYSISGKNHVILLHHILDEEICENSNSVTRFGTTRSGVCPAYSDTARKIGMTFAEFVGPNFETILAERVLPAVEALYGSSMDWKALEQCDLSLELIERIRGFDRLRVVVPGIEKYMEHYAEARDKLRPFLKSENELMDYLTRNDVNMILAGCQSVGLDVINGANRFSSSSVTTKFPVEPDKVYGVMKMVQSSVGQRRYKGNGKWITYDERVSRHLIGETDDEGIERGKTSGRVGDMGFLDSVLVKNNVIVGKIDCLLVTKLDRLGKLLELLGTNGAIPICTAYKVKGRGGKVDCLPEDSSVIEECSPVYTLMEVDSNDFADIERLRSIQEFGELSSKN